MKWSIVACIVCAVVAEPPRPRPARFRDVRFQRQELTTTTDAPSTTTAADDAPYPAAGWAPAQPFSLPNEQPAATYGPPDDAPYPTAGWQPAQPFQLPNEQSPPATSYGTPDTSYGAPTTDAGNDTATTTDNPKAERLEGPVDVQRSEGAYYVLLPGGRLQRVALLPGDQPPAPRAACLQLRAPRLLIRP